MWWNASTGAFLFRQPFSHGMITALSGHHTAAPPPAVMLMTTWKGSIFAISPCSSNVVVGESATVIEPAVLWTSAASTVPLFSVCSCGEIGFAGSSDGVVFSILLLDGKILNQMRVSFEALWSMACAPGLGHRLVAVAGTQCPIFCVRTTCVV
jgi:hypothetical protein